MHNADISDSKKSRDVPTVEMNIGGTRGLVGSAPKRGIDHAFPMDDAD